MSVIVNVVTKCKSIVTLQCHFFCKGKMIQA